MATTKKTTTTARKTAAKKAPMTRRSPEDKARANLVDAVDQLDIARGQLAFAMAQRQQAMRAARAAGLKVVEIQALTGLSSSGATLFAMNGGKTPHA
jgi:hypothetical protein